MDKKGALTGGYVDDRSTRLRLFNDVLALRAKLDDGMNRRAQLQKSLQTIEQEVSKEVTKMRKAEEEKEKERNAVETLAEDIRRSIIFFAVFSIFF